MHCEQTITSFCRDIYYSSPVIFCPIAVALINFHLTIYPSGPAADEEYLSLTCSPPPVPSHPTSAHPSPTHLPLRLFMIYHILILPPPRYGSIVIWYIIIYTRIYHVHANPKYVFITKLSSD